MKKYLLLRNNQETGPYSIEQLASIGLLPLDLIWIEDDSTAWKYPEEIEELKSLIRHDAPLQKLARSLNKNEKFFITLPSNFSQKKRIELNNEYSLPVNETEAILETNYVTPLEELKENYRAATEKKPVWEKRMFASSNAASVISIFIGVVLTAFVVKKMVDDYVPSSEEVTTAIPVIDREDARPSFENIQNALVKEIVPVVKNIPSKKLKITDVKKQLKLAANNYKVGLFGGINGLQLTMFNPSSQIIDKAIVTIEYLKPNGNVVQSETILFNSLKPGTAQTIEAPDSNRGVKVRYKVVKAFSHECKPDLKQV
jgi:hypothetical protein